MFICVLVVPLVLELRAGPEVLEETHYAKKLRAACRREEVSMREFKGANLGGACSIGRSSEGRLCGSMTGEVLETSATLLGPVIGGEKGKAVGCVISAPACLQLTIHDNPSGG